MGMQIRELSVLLLPTEGGRVEAHVLELDVVTYGDGIRHALEMAGDAVTATLEMDVEDGLNPFDRSPAPMAARELFARASMTGLRVPVALADDLVRDAGTPAVFAASMWAWADVPDASDLPLPQREAHNRAGAGPSPMLWRERPEVAA